MEDSVYVFAARLVDYDGVGCTVAVRASQTLEHLHRALRRAFNWYDDHLYSFWLSGVHWDGPETEFTAPYELAESDARNAAAVCATSISSPAARLRTCSTSATSGASFSSCASACHWSPARVIRRCSTGPARRRPSTPSGAR